MKQGHEEEWLFFGVRVPGESNGRFSLTGCPCHRYGSPYPQVHHPNSKGHTETWKSVSPTQRATPKRGNSPPQLKRPRQSVGVHHPNSKGLQRGGENYEPFSPIGTQVIAHDTFFTTSKTCGIRAEKKNTPVGGLRKPKLDCTQHLL